jgi:hypothetical protein
MNKVKKTTLWDRLKAAARSFKGQPVSTLTVGLEVKRCSECRRKEPAHARWTYCLTGSRTVSVNTNMECSRCECITVHLPGVNYNYCPNCGAEMGN